MRKEKPSWIGAQGDVGEGFRGAAGERLEVKDVSNCG